MSNNTLAFFELMRAGLWEKEARLSQFNNIDYTAILQIAEEQSVVGLVTAGLHHVTDVKVPKEQLLQFVGRTLQIEQQNKDMNVFLTKLIDKLRKADVYAILVKGQGIAQCYEKPLWRSSGDIDLLLSYTDYEKSKRLLVPLALSKEKEYTSFKHQSITMESGFVVELHGTQHSRLAKRVDRVIDEVQKDIFYGGNVRSWDNGGTTVFLPAPDSDVIFVFTHILHHLFIDGIGLRQICDWCRLLWKYKDSLNYGLLESRILKMGLMSEWKTFASFVVENLGMPVEAMPFCDTSYKTKGEQIGKLILESGNFGHNIKRRRSDIYMVRKYNALWRKSKNFCRHAKVFPLDSFKFFFHFVGDGMYAAVRGE